MRKLFFSGFHIYTLINFLSNRLEIFFHAKRNFPWKWKLYDNLRQVHSLRATPVYKGNGQTMQKGPLLDYLPLFLPSILYLWHSHVCQRPTPPSSHSFQTIQSYIINPAKIETAPILWNNIFLCERYAKIKCENKNIQIDII